MKIRRISLQEATTRTTQAAMKRLEALAAYRRWRASSPVFARGELAADAFAFLPLRIVDATRLHGLAPGPAVLTADMALRGAYAVFGREARLGFPPRWDVDCDSGKQSPATPWMALDNLDESLTGNKKYVWEINRHHFVTELGRAYASTGEERYAQAVVRCLSDWIDRNPEGIGINWVSSLELAFRCINWLWSLSFIRNSASWSEMPAEKVARSLEAQGRHIQAFLSTYSSPNTHLTGEALGLYCLGIAMPGLRRSSAWRHEGRRILLDQLRHQVRLDGGYFEQSTWYHRYTIEFYILFVHLARQAGEPILAEDVARIEGLSDGLLGLMRPDGTWPRFGDDDGGTLLPFGAGQGEDWRELFHAASVVLGRPDYLDRVGRHDEGLPWLLGVQHGSVEASGIPSQSIALDRTYEASGWQVLRSGLGPDASVLIMDAGPHGVMNCGHAHADALALDVSAAGAAMLVDAGTCTYSTGNPGRNLFRSTAMHNALEVDGLDSSEQGGPFQWKSSARSGCSKFISCADFALVEAWQDGYQRLADPVHHERKVLFVGRQYWVLLDRVRAGANHDYKVHFHWDPRAKVSMTPDGREVIGRNGEAVLQIAYPGGQGEWTVDQQAHSPDFGGTVSTPHACLSRRASGQGFIGVLYPRKAVDATPDIRNVPCLHGSAVAVSCNGVTDFIFHGSGAWNLESAGTWQGDFSWIWGRSLHALPGDGTIVCLGGRRMSGPWCTIEAQGDMDWLKIERSGGTLSLSGVEGTSFQVTVPAEVEVLRVDGAEQQLPDSRCILVHRRARGL